MREEFYENSAAPKNEKMQKVFYAIYNVLFVLSVVALCFFLFMFLFGLGMGFLILSAMTAVFCVILYLMRRRMLTYYDYTFISGEMRIVKIINGKYRKKVVFFDCKDVFLLGKVGSESFERLYDTPDIKKKNASPDGFGAEGNLYYVGVDIQGEKTIVIMACEEKMLSFIATYAGKNAIEKDYGKQQ